MTEEKVEYKTINSWTPNYHSISPGDLTEQIQQPPIDFSHGWPTDQGAGEDFPAGGCATAIIVMGLILFGCALGFMISLLGLGGC